VLGIGVLVLGLLNTSIPVAKLAPYLYRESARQQYLHEGATVSVAELIPAGLNLPLLDRVFKMFSPPKGGVNPNALAGTALLIGPTAWAIAMLRQRGVRYGVAIRAAGGLAALLVTVAILMTQSRMAWVIAAVTVLAFVLRSSFSGRIRWIVALSVMLLPGFMMIPTFHSGRVTVGQAWESGRESLAVRSDVWEQGLRALKGSPWTGIGFNEFRRTYKPSTGSEHGRVAHAHNIWLQTALDIGVPGLLAYAALIALLLVRADSASHGKSIVASRIAAGAGLSLVAVHLFGVADAVALGAKVGLFQWLASGLILGAWRLQTHAPAVSPGAPAIGATRL
jgi:putative inorganic carbon (HCO3(-)) transporter